MATHSSVLPGESHGQRSLEGCTSWGLDVTGRLGTVQHVYIPGLPRWLSGKESACNPGDTGLIPGYIKGSLNILQCSCLENPTDRGPWWAIVHEISKSRMQLNTHECTTYIVVVWSLRLYNFQFSC